MEGTVLDYVLLTLVAMILVVNSLAYLETSPRMYKASKRTRRFLSRFKAKQGQEE